MSYCLDTNIVIDYLRGNEEILNKIKNIPNQDFCITTMTLCELYKGAYLSSDIEENLTIIEEFIDNTEIINLKKESCKTFGYEYEILKKKGKKTEEFDLLIASICIEHNKTLVTRNKKHFENINQLKLEIW